ncbi:hypothetical protein CPLU01_00891 [Colletotrichum plurivorum]|uniref:Uncharacterized protein n=1 Tax=Colletotrichum plurivorum TaxID=2175906 RepID=A0A8H6NQU8_9PEZI|nr:hypothetical protein CPLU01_00891 [Colletotrichum plurivorum]
MATLYPEQRVDLVFYVATSQRVEIERHLAEFQVQKGDTNAAVACLRRLAEEIQHASALLANYQVQASADGNTLASVQNMLNQQLALVATQLSHVEQEAEQSFGGRPMTPPVESSAPAGVPPQRTSPNHPHGPSLVVDNPMPTPAESQRSPFQPPVQGNYNSFPPFTFNLTNPAPAIHTAKRVTWPTADRNYAHPALEPISLKEPSVGPRLAGAVTGALCIRRQLDEQEERAEAEQRARWEVEIGFKVPQAPKNLRKRKGDDLPETPSKRLLTEGGLRGGRESEGGVTFKKVWSRMTAPLKKFGKTPRTDKGRGGGDALAANDDTPSARQQHTHVDHDDCLIKMSSLQTDIPAADWQEQATRTSLATIIDMCEATSSRLKPIPRTISPAHARHKRALAQILKYMKGVELDNFDTAETRASLEDFRNIVEKANREVAEDPGKEALKEATLVNAAVSIADLEEQLDRQRQYAAKVFVGGEATGEVFAKWLRTAQRWLSEEVEFGERACQEPLAAAKGRGRGAKAYHSV